MLVFVVQIVTGIALASAYVPSAGEAYHTLAFISSTHFGHIVRGIHSFGASAMIILIGIHAIRVYLFGAYKYPRQMGWLTGVALLFLVLGMAFTGRLLRWDQTGFWSVVIAAEQAGRTPFIGNWLGHFILAGDTAGGATLSRFFALHVFFIPALIFFFIGFHLYLVIRNGISEPPKIGQPVDPKTYRRWYQDLLHREGVPFWPDAAWRDAVFGLLVIAFIVFMIAYYGTVGHVAPWSPRMDAPPLPAGVVGTTNGPIADGAKVFHDKGCEFCHKISDYGGVRGPDLTYAGDRMTPEQMETRIYSGAPNMPSYTGNITQQQLSDLLAFLSSRRRRPATPAPLSPSTK